MKILINAYACSPNMGSEPGMAWNWCVNLANHCELHIITEGEFKEQIDAVLPTLPQGKKMHFYYNPVSEKVRKMCWNQGDWRFYYYYRKWQYKTYKIAKEIIAKERIDIIHQLNMIGFREPGYLWKNNQIPFIWGPINAKESIPESYLEFADFKTKLFFSIKKNITKLQFRYLKKVKNAAKKAKIVIAASSDSANSIYKYFDVTPIVINESGTNSNLNNNQTLKFSDKEFNLIWVGRFIFTKQLDLAIKTLKFINNINIKLHIVGGSIEEELLWKKKYDNQSLDKFVYWHGKVSQLEVQKLMQKSDLLFFTSIFEGTPHVVLEAISNNLPVLCFNTCGQGDVINEKVGVKIELTNPEQSIKDFAKAINYLNDNRNILIEMSNNCSYRLKELSWEQKAQQLFKLYQKIIKQ
jgi:glycosyltransferase involved in cell wall biosynthesis